MTLTLLSVTYRLRAPAQDFRVHAETAAHTIARAPGLAWKIWGLDPETGRGTSIYLFRDAAAACKAAGVRLCGAALHMRATAEGGFLASADDETFRDGRLMRVLETFSDEVHRVGGTGSSKAVAVIEGHLAAVSVAASAEAIRLGSAAGIPEGRLVPLLLNGSAANAVLRSGRLGDDGWRAPTLLSAWLKRSNDLCRAVRHPSWFGAVAADSLGRFSPSSATRPALAGGAA